MDAARTIAVLSTTCCTAALLCIVSLSVILSHWHDALDSCTHADCGCLLYARATTSSYTITGSDVSLCWFSALAPLPGLLVAGILAGFYGHRGYIVPRRKTVRGQPRGGRVLLALPNAPRPREATVGSPRSAARVSKHMSKMTACYTVQAVMCVFMALFAVAHVGVLTDGFLVACREYRHAVLKTLKASGSLALLVNERLSCPVIFDFLDYMKPDAREVLQGINHWFPGQRKLSTVNTGAALVISLLAAYAHMLLWFVLSVKFAGLAQWTARQAREASKARHSRVQYALHSTDL